MRHTNWDRRRIGRWTRRAGATVLLSLLSAAGVAEAKEIPRGPAAAEFYEAPGDLPKGHGKAIWQRTTTNATVELDRAKYTKKILYTSKSPQRERIVVSGSFSIPKGKTPKRGWPVITYAHGTTGVADQCAPSRVQAGSEDQSETTYVYPELNDWLKVGYAILRTDYPGLGTSGPRPYLIGKSAARGVLDIVRAARQVESELGERYLIAGHSQGGQAALFAGRYAASWIPELKPRGTVSYAPASHLTLQLETLPLLTTASSLSAEAALTLFGAATANPGVVPTELLTSEANALYPEVGRKCLAELERPDSLGGLPPSELIAPGADTRTLRQVLDKNNPAVSIPEPIFLAQGGADTTVPPALTDLLNGELRELGDDVTYMLYPGVSHTGIVAAAEPDALTFMEERLPPG